MSGDWPCRYATRPQFTANPSNASDITRHSQEGDIVPPMSPTTQEALLRDAPHGGWRQSALHPRIARPREHIDHGSLSRRRRRADHCRLRESAPAGETGAGTRHAGRGSRTHQHNTWTANPSAIAATCAASMFVLGRSTSAPRLWHADARRSGEIGARIPGVRLAKRRGKRRQATGRGI
jgi:hypothetical protein